ncbi:MAG: DUF3891 family protein [Tepidisphaeraceae bacterium]
MIRRRVDDCFCLIAQHEHALLSGRLAAHYGNSRFERPKPLAEVVEAVSMHDCGWQEYDRRPALNPSGYPYDVFETPLGIALRAWARAGEMLAEAPTYARLLVSLHVMGLSGFAAQNIRTRRAEFDINRFQHAEAERQETLRRQLSMRLDVPLKLGLAVVPEIAEEEQLRRNHNTLQAMDRLSLVMCCAQTPFSQIEGIVPREGARAMTLQFTRTAPWSMKVEPWPFDQEEIRLVVNARTVEAREYQAEEFQEAYEQASEEAIHLRVHS